MKFWLDMPLKLVLLAIAVCSFVHAVHETNRCNAVSENRDNWKKLYLELVEEKQLPLGPGGVVIEVPPEPCPGNCYKHLYGCTNCGHEWNEHIEKGMQRPRCVKCPTCQLEKGCALVSENWR